MSYYKEIKLANNYVQEEIETFKDVGMNMEKLIYETTNKYEVGEKHVRARIEQILRLRPDLELVKGRIQAKVELDAAK